MEKLFDFAFKPKIENTESLYEKDGYFNYIPYEKIRKYTDIEDVVTKDDAVFVSSRTKKKVSCALIICTYKREKTVKRNVDYLAEKIKSQSDFECTIILVDNARTLSERELAKDVLLIPNVNSGGSGGYRRGMEETAKIGGFTHFILMDACRKYGIERFHQVSTDEVYGDLPLDRPDLFFTETTPLHTSSPYSSSKAGADLLVQAYHRTFGLPITISRCSNNYGPYQFPEKLIPLMISNAMNDKALPVYGEGINVRDWLYVEDHCAAIDLIIHNGKVGEVYNIGGHNEMRNIDIVKLICKALGKSESLITYVTDRKGHDMRYAIDPAKIHTELGWLPQTKFADGIQKTIQWYLDNKPWWEHILSGEYQKSNII